MYINIFSSVQDNQSSMPCTQWSGKACIKVFSNCYFIDFFKIEIVNVPKDWFLIESWIASLANFFSLMIKIMHVCICKTFSYPIIFDYLQVRWRGLKHSITLILPLRSLLTKSCTNFFSRCLVTLSLFQSEWPTVSQSTHIHVHLLCLWQFSMFEVRKLTHSFHIHSKMGSGLL